MLWRLIWKPYFDWHLIRQWICRQEIQNHILMNNFENCWWERSKLQQTKHERKNWKSRKLVRHGNRILRHTTQKKRHMGEHQRQNVKLLHERFVLLYLKPDVSWGEADNIVVKFMIRNNFEASEMMQTSWKYMNVLKIGHLSYFKLYTSNTVFLLFGPKY